ncbi:putative mycofactocin-associated electron transfer flavoprotein, partial [Frankia sp. CNm7]|nr:putative mycofactocin-associated electron transfer flavoprotein [Frankia nepalensis]
MTAGSTAGPLVAVCLRVTDLRPEVDPLTGVLTQSPHGAGLSPADEAALERALTLAEAWSGRVLAVTAGPPIADGPLRAAAALGAQVLRVAWPPADGAPAAAPGGAHAHGPGLAAGRDPEPVGPVTDYHAPLAGDTRARAEARAGAMSGFIARVE